MSDPRVCILVLNWNGARDTLACLQSLSLIQSKQVTSIVIDNGSTDDSVTQIRKAFPQVTLLELPENLLFGGGNNAGLKWASEQGFDYVIFLNNDTEVEPDFVEPLLKAFSANPDLGMAGPLICYFDRPELIWYGGGIVNLWTGVVAHKLIRNRALSAGSMNSETDYITGCCLMMPTDLAMTLGGFDPLFTMYGEDVDLSLRCKSLGKRLAFVPSSKVFHKVSSSTGGEFGLGKLKRKALGMLKIYGRHARWYQWGSILIAQLILSLSYIFTYLRHGSRSEKQVGA